MAPKKSKTKRKKAVAAQLALPKQPSPLVTVLDSPVLSNSLYDVYLAKAGYVLTGLIFLLILFILLNGYSKKPTILEENLLAKIYSEWEQGNKSVIRNLYKEQELSLASVKDQPDIKILHMKVQPGEPVGFIVPSRLIPKPDKNRKIGVSLVIQYVGDLTLLYNCSPDDKEVYHKILQQTGSPGTMLGPLRDKTRRIVTTPSFFPVEKFHMPWDESEIFFFCFQANEPTEAYIYKIAIIEG